MANKVLHLDFSKDPIMPPIIYGRIGDEKMQTVTVKISRRDEIPDLTGGIIRFEGEPAGGNVKVFDSDNVHSTSIGLQKGTFEYTFPSAVFSVEGNYQRAYFSFEKDGKRDTTGDFKIIVKKNADITNPEAETIITEYNRLVQKLEEAYQKALTKVGADYDDIVIRIEGIKTQISLLLTQINKIVTDAEGRISGVEKTVTDSLNNALKELHAANFYTKDDTDKKFQMKDAQPLPEGVTSFDQLSDFSGQTFYLTAAQAVSMSDYDSLPLEFQRNFSFYVENKSAITGHYRLQIVQPVTLIQAIPAIRMVGKGIGSNPFMRLLTKEDLDYSNLVNNALVAKKELIVAQDWNTIKEPGMYAVNGATGLNRPAGAFVGNLLVQQAGGMNSLAQFFIGNEQLNTRRYTGSTWLAWQTVALEPQQTPLWTGAWYGGPTSITLSKALSKCRNGIILQWQEYSATGTVQNTQYSFTYIPKQHLTNGGARGTNCYVGGYGSKEIYGKYLYINDTTITGNDVNAPATVATGVGIKKYVLVTIWEV